jgi:60S ribosome subunit biogenesis protein NIP7
MNEVPLGFGVAARSATDCRRAEPTAIVVLHQADLGEYLRNEATLT